MTSRLDRLFLLLDTGSSAVTRKAAAQQLGEVQRLHPQKLGYLLTKVYKYLHSTNWDTRIAASQAITAIIENLPQWAPSPVPKTEDGMDTKCSATTLSHRLSADTFDLEKVMRSGKHLLGSEGKQFEKGTTAQEGEATGAEELARQRKALNKRLGLDVCDKLMGINGDELFTENDLINDVKSEDNGDDKRDIQDILHLKKAPPSEENNKNKDNNDIKDEIKSECDNIDNNDNDGPPSKRAKLAQQTSTDGKIVVGSMNDTNSALDEQQNWPLEEFTESLLQDLFNAQWEYRHGAATGLREIIKLHGRGAGVTTGMTASEMQRANQLYLEDISLRIICVLSLDKFGDYLSDQVVAPVRETCAQTLGFCLQLLSREGVNSMLGILLQLAQTKDLWEARHGGLLGIKYLLAIRTGPERREIIPKVFQPLYESLSDINDDISAVAASAFLPIISEIPKLLPGEMSKLSEQLWQSLADLDELSSSTFSILSLLSNIIPHCPTSSHCRIPLLYPFLSHHTLKVRLSVLASLKTIADLEKSESSLVTTELSNILRLLFQRSLLEPEEEALSCIVDVWECILRNAPLAHLLYIACPLLSGWLCLVMHPSKIAIDPSQQPSWLDLHGNSCRGAEQFYVGGKECLAEPTRVRERIVLQARMTASKMLGALSYYVTQKSPGTDYTNIESPMQCYAKVMLFHLGTKSALQRSVVAMVLREWLEFTRRLTKDELYYEECPEQVSKTSLACLQESVLYDEAAPSFTRLQHDCRDFIALLRHYNLPLDANYTPQCVLTADQANYLANQIYQQILTSSKLKQKVIDNLEEKRKMVLNAARNTINDQLKLSIMTQNTLAALLVCLPSRLPNKLNPIIRPLMDSLKKEYHEPLQTLSAKYLATMLKLALSREQCPNSKVIKNLVGYLCCDPEFTPTVTNLDSVQTDGVITLQKMNKTAEQSLTKRPWLRRTASTSTPPGTPSTPTAAEVPVTPTTPGGSNPFTEDETAQIQKAMDIQRRGAQVAFQEIALYFKEKLFDELPKLLEIINDPLDKWLSIKDRKNEDSAILEVATEMIQGLQTLESICQHMDSALHGKLVKEILPKVSVCSEHPWAVVRHMAARCIGKIASADTKGTMGFIIRNLMANLGAGQNDILRQGAVECLFSVIESLDIKIVPYISLLIVPMLARMTDQKDTVRLLATQGFASLVRMMPLEDANRTMQELDDEDLKERIRKERKFVEQLLNAKHAESYNVPIKINAELRSYQQEGVNWLGFLNKYKLHGILCDDMGLGKTLQSICILASDHHYRQQDYKATKNVDSSPLPSLVVCPPTLTGHWVYEIDKFVDKKYLNPLHYTGPPYERQRLQQKAKRYNVIVASYDIVRNDIDFFGNIRWNYVILDEGHVIKNNKTKLSKAIKMLRANHRLILSGTPIQNNVVELWNLFDFLMPGFLGSERLFSHRYAKPILASRDAKSSSKEQEAGVLAMESLHRQVLPFLLRRMKEDVLSDLPPKIIQDYYCELSPLQLRLYEDFSKSKANSQVCDSLRSSSSDSADDGQPGHVFQALQYLRKVCNHPKLALTTSHPEYDAIIKQLHDEKSSLNDISVSSKLLSLKQLLLDCGIGTAEQNDSVVNAHRCLVFFQLKSMLDLVENDLLKKHMPSVSYLRLDGSIPAGDRHSLVQKFNNDPSIDLLLLTSQVGGLGLNLTGADTVIFVEHDWNPMKDLQAMDRAHRIGQKKVVNVYRLITRNTLEEKIMGLQRFKMSIANTVISGDNSSLQTMATDQLIDLFSIDKEGSDNDKNGKNNDKPVSMKNLLENLPDLWDTSKYDEQYDLSAFMQTLAKK